MPAVIDAPLDKIQILRSLQLRRREQARSTLSRYYADPVAFVHDCFDFPEGVTLAPYQEEVLASIPEKKKVAQRGPHGLGKTMTSAIAIIWFALTRDATEVDWKCAVTAGTWRQLEQYLFPEVHRWVRFLKWPALRREPFSTTELLRLNLNLNFGRAFAVASSTPAYIEGVHADSVFYIYDEAKSIGNDTFDASEGAFSGGPGTEAFALASSTPGLPLGRFYDIQMRKAGLEDWWPRHVTLEEAIGAGRISRAWAEQRARQWGPNSALYANRVEGQFHAADEDAIIPLSWLEDAVERWKEHQADALPPLRRVGVDVAAEGDDATVLSLIYGDRVNELRTYHGSHTTETSGNVRGILAAEGNEQAVAVVDCDGLGVSVKHELADEGFDARVLPFHAQTATDRKDRSGELGFEGAKAEAWWRLRESLDPQYGPALELPDDPVLLSDLTAPHWSVNKRGQIVIEKKVDVKKRLGRSPDAGDSVVMGLWEGQRPHRRRRMVAAGRAA